MGSSISKTKKSKKRNSDTSTTATAATTATSAWRRSKWNSKARSTRSRPLSDSFLPQNPPQWSDGRIVHRSSVIAHDNLDLHHDQEQQFKIAEVDSGRKSARNSDSNNAPQQSNMSQPRTSISNSRSSFSLRRGRKGSQIQQEENGQDLGSRRLQHPILRISSPIVEPETTPESPTDQPPTPRRIMVRQSLDSSRSLRQPQMFAFNEPRRIASGAYKAPVPALPISAQSAVPPPAHQTSTRSPLASESPSSLLPSGSTSAPIQEPQSLWKESLRKVTVAEILKNDPALGRSSSVSSSKNSNFLGKGVKKNKKISGPTFVSSSLSPSPSNASQTSVRRGKQRSGKNNIIHPESSLGSQHIFLSRPQDKSENTSTTSLPGSRYMGREGGAGNEDDDSLGHLGSAGTSRNASEISLAGSPITFPLTEYSSSSLAGISTYNSHYNSQSSSPHPSTSNLHQQQRGPQTAAPVGDGTPGLFSIRNRALNTKTAASSLRESMSSISTANYQWMDEQVEDAGTQDTTNRDSVLMSFNSLMASEFSDSTKSLLAGGLGSSTSEQISQQHLDQHVLQHALLKYFFKGNYRAPLSKEGLRSVLDVGCGSGLWMKDMALEFPLAEVHGVDLMIPKHHRRPKATSTLPGGSGSLSTPTSPLFPVNKKTDPHSNIQNNAPSVSSSKTPTDAGTSSTPVAFRQIDSMPSNCFFHKADILMGLPFPDNTFDYCHVRLVLWGYHLNSFPDLLNELIRVTKKGGWIEFVDMDPCIMKATETGSRINEWIKTGLIHSNMDPDLVKTLPQFLREFSDATVNAAMRDDDILDHDKNGGSFGLPTAPYGLDHLKTAKVSLPFGPWGGQVGKLWQHCYIDFLRELEPMMIDVALSGLIMDQYHRQCKQEMQDLAEAAAAQSSDQQQEVITNFDQKLCTRKAWTHLIHQLIRDSEQSATLSPNSGLKSPTSISSIMEMRSYTNFHIAYAQKADLVELKQQILLQQLEKVILSPNFDIASSSSFSLPSTATFGAIHSKEQTPKRQSGVDVYESSAPAPRRASTLHEKISSLNLHQQYISSGSGTTGNDDSVPLTINTTETDNRGNNHEDQALPTTSPSSSVVAPTPTSVAALSIRSGSRSSNRNGSVPGIVSPKIGASGLITSTSVCHSPRVAASGFSRTEPVQGGMGSPKRSLTLDEGRDDGVRPPSEPDYFNHVPTDEFSAYHQEQDNQQQQQQQMSTVKQKASPLTKALSPSAGLLGAAGTAIGASHNASMLSGAEEAAAEECDDHQSSEQQEDVTTLSVDTERPTTSEERNERQPQRPAERPAGNGIMAGVYEDDEGSDVVLLQDVQDDSSQEEFGTSKDNESPEGYVGMVSKHQVITSVVRPELHQVPIKSFSAEIEHIGHEMEGNDEDTNNIINHAFHDETSSEKQEQADSDIVDESQLQMLQVDDEGEAAVTMASEKQEVEKEGSASAIEEEGVPEHHSVVSVSTPILQDKDEVEQAHAEQGILTNETSNLEIRDPIRRTSITSKSDSFIEDREVASGTEAKTEVEVESRSPTFNEDIPIPVPTPASMSCPVTEPEGLSELSTGSLPTSRAIVEDTSGEQAPESTHSLTPATAPVSTPV